MTKDLCKIVTVSKVYKKERTQYHNMSSSVKITIRPYYKSDTMNYTVGIIENLGLYVLQATDTQGFIMGIPGKTTSEAPAMAVFGISKEEFELKDNDRERLDDLAGLLMRELPQDRIIVENNLRTEGRADTVDNGKYAAEKVAELEAKKKELEEKSAEARTQSAERAKKLIAEIVKNGEGWFIYTKGTGKIVPTIDNSGAAQLFSKQEYAQLVVEKAPEIPLAVQKMDKNGLNLFFSNLFRYGILRIKVDLLQAEGGEVARDEAVSFRGFKGYDLMGSKLFSDILRYVQAKQITKEELSKQSCAVAWSMLSEDFVKGIFLAPMCFAGEEGKEITEKEIFFSERAVPAIKEMKPAILGIDKFTPTNAAGKTMKFTTLKNNDGDSEKTFLPIYTDLTEFLAAFGGKARPFFITYEDIHEKYTACFGVVVNSATVNFAITKAGMESFDRVNKDSGKQ